MAQQVSDRRPLTLGLQAYKVQDAHPMSRDQAYRIHVQYDAENDGFAARVPELGLRLEAPTRAEVLTLAESEIEDEIGRRVTAGEELPVPIDGDNEPMKFSLQLSGVLSRELRFHAHEQKVSAEELALQLVARGLGALEGSFETRQAPAANKQKEGRRQEGRNDGRNQQKRGRRREGYRPEMDNQADFLAYVRDQEKGGRGNR